MKKQSKFNRFMEFVAVLISIGCFLLGLMFWFYSFTAPIDLIEATISGIYGTICFIASAIFYWGTE